MSVTFVYLFERTGVHRNVFTHSIKCFPALNIYCSPFISRTWFSSVFWKVTKLL